MLLSTLERLVSILGSSAASNDSYDNPLNMWMEEDDKLLTEPLESLEDLRVGELVKMVLPWGEKFIQILSIQKSASKPNTIYYRESDSLQLAHEINFKDANGLFVAHPIKIRDCVPYDGFGASRSRNGRYTPQTPDMREGPVISAVLNRQKRRIEEAKRIGHGRP